MLYDCLLLIYGMLIIFYSLMAWIFKDKWGDRVYRMMVCLMVILCIGCIKDIPFLFERSIYCEENDHLLSAIDMVVVPMYILIMYELLRPGLLTRLKAYLSVSPFILLAVLYVLTRVDLFYYILLVISIIFGTTALVWTTIEIPKYQTRLKQRYSYTDNIDLRWLRGIVYAFYFILGLWVVACVKFDEVVINILYLCGTLVLGMFISYFMNRHESVLAEFEDAPIPMDDSSAEKDDLLGRNLDVYMREGKAYLNPNLKLSDLATAMATNRTYISNFINHQLGTTFYDYVNSFRVEHACGLLTQTDKTISVIAEESGFNSPQSFIRVYTRIKGLSPTEYRKGR